MKRKQKQSITRQQFDAEYNEIRERLKDIKKVMRMLESKIRPLTRRAWKLYREGDDSLYTSDKNHMLVPSFKSLPNKMETLNGWANLDLLVHQFLQEW